MQSDTSACYVRNGTEMIDRAKQNYHQELQTYISDASRPGRLSEDL